VHLIDQPVPLFLLVIPVFSTLAGGLLAVRFRRSLVLLIALGAGLLLGAAFLDLMPEAISIGLLANWNPADVLALTLVSFLGFFGVQYSLDALTTFWNRSAAASRVLGRIGGGMLIFHSLRDGMAIGLSYAASHPAGYAVAIGIAAHDIGDGMNTVILTTGGEKPRMTDYLFLAADCLAPFLGGLLTIWWTFSLRSSVVLLALAAGFFIQMATSDFLPEVRHCKGSRRHLLPAILAGAAVIYTANLLMGRLH
jgi:zinc and cadmium transporter